MINTNDQGDPSSTKEKQTKKKKKKLLLFWETETAWELSNWAVFIKSLLWKGLASFFGKAHETSSAVVPCVLASTWLVSKGWSEQRTFRANWLSWEKERVNPDVEATWCISPILFATEKKVRTSLELAVCRLFQFLQSSCCVCSS